MTGALGRSAAHGIIVVTAGRREDSLSIRDGVTGLGVTRVIKRKTLVFYLNNGCLCRAVRAACNRYDSVFGWARKSFSERLKTQKSFSEREDAGISGTDRSPRTGTTTEAMPERSPARFSPGRTIDAAFQGAGRRRT